jgi:hypothetical protein
MKPFQKKDQVMRLRVTEEMAHAIRQGADLDDRQVQGQIRHLLRLGLEVWQRRMREAR